MTQKIITHDVPSAWLPQVQELFFAEIGKIQKQMTNLYHVRDKVARYCLLSADDVAFTAMDAARSTKESYHDVRKALVYLAVKEKCGILPLLKDGPTWDGPFYGYTLFVKTPTKPVGVMPEQAPNIDSVLECSKITCKYRTQQRAYAQAFPEGKRSERTAVLLRSIAQAEWDWLRNQHLRRLLHEYQGYVILPKRVAESKMWVGTDGFYDYASSTHRSWDGEQVEDMSPGVKITISRKPLDDLLEESIPLPKARYKQQVYVFNPDTIRKSQSEFMGSAGRIDLEF